MRAGSMWKLCAICGRAVTMIVPSRFSMKKAQATIRAVSIERPPTHDARRPVTFLLILYRRPRPSLRIALAPPSREVARLFPALPHDPDLRQHQSGRRAPERAHRAHPHAPFEDPVGDYRG